MPTGSPWARLPLDLNILQSPGLGLIYISKHPGQEASASSWRVRGRRQASSKSKVPGVEVEALGLILPVPALPMPSQQHPASVWGVGEGLPSGYSLPVEHKPPAQPLWL